MDRLTFEGDFCTIAMCQENPCQYDNSCTQREVWERLKAYEDTGLEPEDISALCAMSERAKIADLLRLEEYQALGSINHLREVTQAEKDGRLVVLPCKVGDIVYMPIGRWNTITGFEEDKCDGFHIARDGILQIKAQCYSGNHGTYGIPGETVFLTREEAEAAMREKGERGAE